MARADWIWQEAPVPETPTVTVGDNPEVGRLYGPDGRLVRIVRARTERPVGFRPTPPPPPPTASRRQPVVDVSGRSREPVRA
jgi:hypothetical protein